MRKGLRVLLWVGGGLVLLLVVTGLALKMYLTRDRILEWVVPPLEARLHRRVIVADAGAGLTGIHLDGLEVRAEGAAEPLVAARRIRVRWNLWALLRGTVEVKEVRLVEPRIHVVRRSDGTLDIDDLLGPSGAGERAAGEAPPGGGEGMPVEVLPVEVLVGLFSIEGGRVSFEDRTARPPRTYVLDEVDSRVRGFALDRPVPFTLSARIPLAGQGRFEAEGEAIPGARSVSARVRVTRFDLPGLNAVMGGGLGFASGTFTLDLQVDAAAGGAARAEGTAGIQGLVLESRGRRGETVDVKVSLACEADQAARVVRLTRLDVEAAGQEVHLTATARYGLPRPRVEFELTSPALRVDPLTALLPPSPGEPVPGDDAARVPAEGPRGAPAVPVDVVGDVRIGRVEASGAALEDLRARVELVDGRLRVDPVDAGLYGGSLTASAGADLSRPGPAFEARLGVEGTSVGDLLAAVEPSLGNTLTGTLELTAHAVGRGGDLSALTSDIRAQVRDGRVLNHPLVTGFARLFRVKELETLSFYTLRLEAGTAGGVAEVRRLVLNGPSVQVTGTGTLGLEDQALDMRLAVALPRRLAARLVRNPGVLDAVADDQGWARLPLRLGGTLGSPSYGLDSEALARMAGRVAGKRAEKLLEEKVLPKVPFEEGAKGLFKQGLRKLLGPGD